jgi:hypothetical protein
MVSLGVTHRSPEDVAGVCSGLALAAMTGALYALGMYVGPLSWNLGDDAFDLLMVVGIMLSTTAFFVEFLGLKPEPAAGS